MPAVTLAGALALAGCGGGDNPAPVEDDDYCYRGTCYDSQEELDKAIQAAIDAGIEQAETDAEEEEMSTAAKERLGNLEGTALPAKAQPALGTPDQVAAAVKAIKDGSGTAKSDDGKIEVTVYELKGMREKTAEPKIVTEIANNNVDPDDKIMGSAFTGTGDVVKHMGTQSGSTGPYTFRTSGSYNGAAGTYVCTHAAAADGCTSRNAGEDGVILSGGTWKFTANPGEKAYDSDTKYAQYGWWLNTGAAGGSTAPQVGAWYEITGDSSLLNIDNAVGSATYEGKAAGQAALYNSRATSGNVGGAFTADVTLTASFGAADAGGKLKGSITDFKIGDHEPDWTVELMEKDISTGTKSVAVGKMTTKWSLGEDDKNAGKSGDWQASFYDQTGANHPKGVAGGFHSDYGTDGSMVGSFAAEK